MKWMLDTNACIRYLNGRSPNLKQHVDATDPADIRVCSVVKAELFFGAARSTDPAGTLQRQQHFLARFPSLVFDDAAAEVYGDVRAKLQALGTPIGPNDLLIAAIAVANGVTLVTHNVNEFGRVPRLSIVDWEV
jgi:tRNA(fMet)-specific endonuclease VapC